MPPTSKQKKYLSAPLEAPTTFSPILICCSPEIYCEVHDSNDGFEFDRGIKEEGVWGHGLSMDRRTPKWKLTNVFFLPG